MIDKIKKALGEATEGCSKEEKLKFLKGLGFASMDEIEALEHYEKLKLLKDLKEYSKPPEPVITNDPIYVDTINRYKVRRGDSPRDTGFIIPKTGY